MEIAAYVLPAVLGVLLVFIQQIPSSNIVEMTFRNLREVKNRPDGTRIEDDSRVIFASLVEDYDETRTTTRTGNRMKLLFEDLTFRSSIMESSIATFSGLALNTVWLIAEHDKESHGAWYYLIAIALLVGFALVLMACVAAFGTKEGGFVYPLPRAKRQFWWRVGLTFAALLSVIPQLYHLG